VDRIDQLHIGEGVGDPPQGCHNVGHGLPVVLTPVTGDQDDPAGGVVQTVEDLLLEGELGAHRGLEGVDDRVSGEEHPLGDVLPGQVFPVGHGGAEVEVGDGPHHLPVHLLGIWGPLIVGP